MIGLGAIGILVANAAAALGMEVYGYDALSRNEYGILKILMENTGKIVSRERLMERLWETDSFIDDNTLTVNVNRLRKKLEGAGLRDFITTKFGVGYVIFSDEKGQE